ncbi:MAG TPA: 4-hydroxybenzoate 3-monooxygenase [Candidatus Methylomirabilis sp.]|nr:4-hydroxybenzoate 3-monooxygenase [Candidatus Methylomirabilis sp.]
MRTQVVIVGAGPSGLLLSHLLSQQGVDSVVLERRTREYVEQRVRAGLLEQGTVDLLREAGLADRLDREGLVHEGFELRFDGSHYRLPFTELTGWTTCMYGQQEVVKDLIKAREAAGGHVYFAVDDVRLVDVETDAPRVSCTVQGELVEIVGDFLAGCDGFHGVCRHAIPEEARTTYEHAYPFAWLGILASVPPSTVELIYGVHERGFALHSMRSPAVSRLYLQVSPAEPLANWPDERIWAELRTRFALDGREVLNEGPIMSRGVTEMRSFVIEPMQYRRLFLVGDAAHIVPPSAAKGLNLAVADVRLLATALTAWYADGSRELLDGYSRAALAHVWQGQEFSAVMTSLLHRFPAEDGYAVKLRQARLRDLVTSRATATSFAEHYVGLARARLTSAIGARTPSGLPPSS